MPRSSRRSSSSGGSRTQSRGASTQAAPPTQYQQPGAVPAQVPQRGGGFMSNIIGTAAGVGLGSVVGHGVSNALFGGGSSAPVESAPASPDYQGYNGQQQQQQNTCAIQAKDFTSCLQATNNDMTACGFYLEQLKACQQMASQY